MFPGCLRSPVGLVSPHAFVANRPSRFRLTTTAVMAPRAPKGNNSAPESSSEGVAERALLRTGARMPLLGLGTWKIPTDQCPTLVREAISRGWRHIDCACDYGNEREVGAGIASALASGVCAREDLWVTSKLWNTYHRQEHVRDACKRTLDDLGLDYLDLYLIHFPISLAFVPFETRYPRPSGCTTRTPRTRRTASWCTTRPVAETWRAMEALVDEGLVKNIGVCNFNVSLLTDLLAGARARRGAPASRTPTSPSNTSNPSPRKPACTSQPSRRWVPRATSRWDGPNPRRRHQRTVRRGGGEGARRHPGQVLLRWAVQRGTARFRSTTKLRASVGEHRRLRRVVSTHPGGDGRRPALATTTGTTTRPSFVRAWADRAHLMLRRARVLVA